jgi:uncharacterized protein YukE
MGGDGFVNVKFSELKQAADTVHKCVERIEDHVQTMVNLLGKNVDKWEGDGGGRFLDLKALMEQRLYAMNAAAGRAVDHAYGVHDNLFRVDMQMAKRMGNTPFGGKTL